MLLPRLACAVFLASAGVGLSAQTLTVTYPTHVATSPRISQLHGSPFVSGPTVIHHPPVPAQGRPRPGPDGALQLTPGSAISVTAGTSFEGMNVFDGGYIPPDNNIAVGPNHIVEVVNAALAVYSKTGATLQAPVPLKNLWTSLTGSACAANNGGDTVVVYDRQADRWLVTQLGSLSKPYSECVAVSQTGDPAGAYNLYAYGFGSNLNDYPKWSVWPTASNSAYLATYNLFLNGTSFIGPQICAYDRMAMIGGAANPAALCYTGLNGASYLPSDLDGATAPLDGTPAYFASLYGSSLGLYSLAPNFSNSTASLSPFSTIDVASYTQAADSPQPGTSRQLDALSDRLMFRLAFRRFADHQSMVVNHSVAGGVRWYELQSPVSSNGTFTLYQQGTYGPDGSARWMGSSAMDQAGNIALGYSVSSAGVYPSIRYTGRSPGDPPGSMGAENSIIEGSGSQTGYTRWGDYTSLRVDPGDDCTFWYVNEYYPVTASFSWHTRIGSFKFNNCVAGADFALSANPNAVTIQRGSTATSNIGVSALNGYGNTVTLSPSCPAGVSCSLNPTQVTPPANSSTLSALSVVTSLSTAPAGYSLSVTGTDKTLTHTTAVSANVYATFSLGLAPASLTVSRGSSGSATVSVTGDGGSAFPVQLGVSGLPQGIRASFSANPLSATSTSNMSTLTLTAQKSARTGSYTLTVWGTGGGNPATPAQTLTLTIP